MKHYHPRLGSDAARQLTHVRTNMKDLQVFKSNFVTFGVHQTYYCSICCEHYPLAETEHVMLSGCSHVFCQDCFLGFLTSEISSNNVYMKCFSDTRYIITL